MHLTIPRLRVQARVDCMTRPRTIVFVAGFISSHLYMTSTVRSTEQFHLGEKSVNSPFGGGGGQLRWTNQARASHRKKHVCGARLNQAEERGREGGRQESVSTIFDSRERTRSAIKLPKKPHTKRANNHDLPSSRYLGGCLRVGVSLRPVSAGAPAVVGGSSVSAKGRTSRA